MTINGNKSNKGAAEKNEGMFLMINNLLKGVFFTVSLIVSVILVICAVFVVVAFALGYSL